MKKSFFLMGMTLLVFLFQSCSKDNETNNDPEESEVLPEEQISDLEKKFISIENAEYHDGSFPGATTERTLGGIDMSTYVMNGAINYITVITEDNILKFFVGIKDVSGFLEYVPSSNTNSDATGYKTYVLPVMISQSYMGNSVIVLSGQLENGDITTPIENEISYIETMPGEVEIKLAFSNSKDVDLHLYTPSGEHIYYANRGGTYTTDEGDEISYGLDIDSNADCKLDNINKENIYIPSELVEKGIYTVVVNMYSNCDPSIPTNWSVIARYKGKVVVPTDGANPASGVYPAGAGYDDMTTVMTFAIEEEVPASRVRTRRIVPNSFRPIPVSDVDEMKEEEEEYRRHSLMNN